MRKFGYWAEHSESGTSEDVMVVQSLLLLLGFIILVGGAEFLVRGARRIALLLGIPTLIVGLTVVAFGTSAPELFVSLAAAIEGNGDVAIGNIIGSNICNILLIVGITACLSPIVIAPSLIKREMPIMLITLILFIVFSYDLKISRVEGGVLVLGLFGYLYLNYLIVTRGESSLQAEVLEAEGSVDLENKGILHDIGFLLLGLAGLVIGAELIVTNATLIAREVGISDLVIGVTLIALGTSLPELATTVIAAIQKEADLAVGNAVGSNIFNVLSVVGFAALTTPLAVKASALSFDMVFMLLSSLLLWPVMIFFGTLGRISGVLMLLAYGGYIYASLRNGAL